jgi:hypothetical protein
MNAATAQQRLDEAEVINIWPAPDMSVLNAGRRSPVPMGSGLFGPAWPLLNLIAEGTATPVDYPAVGYLAACASLIGGKRRVKPYASTHWSEPCILWLGAVGDPSSRKSPALEAVTNPLGAIERDKAEEHKANLRAYDEDLERAKASRAEWQSQLKEATKAGNPPPPMPDAAAEPAEPCRRRTIVQDATPEAVGAILAGNPMGTLHFRDELAGWLTSFDRYAPGGREFWLEAYGGRPFVIDRKGTKEPLVIPFNGVSVLGGIQPAKLADALLSSVDDGLVARFIWAWPDKVAFRRPQAAADLHVLEQVYRNLDALPWASDMQGERTARVIPLSASAADTFEQWQHDNAAVDDDASSLFKSFVGKMDGAVLRLALVCEYAGWAFRGGSEPDEVTFDSLVASAEFVDDYAKSMAERVYGDAALPAVERLAAVLARYIVKQRMARINKRTLKQSPHKSRLPGLRNADTMNQVVEFLVDAGWLMPSPSREGATAGREKADYIVNPAVHGV